jgi:diketogulonate reductase-like aldo/keto reductase
MVSLPILMYGTAWKEEATRSLTLLALRAGFRAIDTANQRRHYFEEGVGEALQESYAAGLVQREELFLQTKFTHAAGQDHRLPYDPTAPVSLQVEQSLQSSLQHLHTDYLDSYVLHGPSKQRGWSDEDGEVWTAMERAVAAGKARAIGVSNVSLEQLQTLCKSASIQPSFVQNRCYARTGWDQAVRAFCTGHSITYQGFSLLTANGEILRHPTFRSMVQHTQRTPAQLVFRFARQVGMLPLTGTTQEAHMLEDLAVGDFELSAEDVRAIESIFARS